jgi:hypothetical protein
VGNARVEPKGNAIISTEQASGSAKIDPLMVAFNAGGAMLAPKAFSCQSGRDPPECLDHIVVFGEAHLRRRLAAYYFLLQRPPSMSALERSTEASKWRRRSWHSGTHV